MVQERKGMLKVWNMVLVALAFELSILGTFLTRSGVINSIHSFAKSSIGAWFLFFLIASALFSTALILWRLPLLRAKTKLESPLSREATFLYNNLLLVALCLTILWGVIFPILTDLFLNQTRTIGRPYFDFFLRVFGIPLLLLMGIGPLIAWRRSSVRGLLKILRWPIAAALVTGGLLIALGYGSSTPGVIAYSFCAFVLATIVVELVRGTRVTGSLFELVSRNRRRYGGYVVHASIVLLAIGIVGSSSYSSEKDVQLKPGQSVAISGRTVTYDRLERDRSSNANEIRAVMTVRGRGSSGDGTLKTGINNYFNGDTSREVGILTSWPRAEDTYVIFDQRDAQTGVVFFKVLVKPLVNLIWVAGIVFLFGSLVALWPDAREQRRLISRLALARA
jgi:cytochrome c-type biogenesis protein CcmF